MRSSATPACAYASISSLRALPSSASVISTCARYVRVANPMRGAVEPGASQGQELGVGVAPAGGQDLAQGQRVGVAAVGREVGVLGVPVGVHDRLVDGVGVARLGWQIISG